jgi:TPR repeat protein
MDDKKIQELITLSGMHDHQAQKELGIYYASLPKTNRNIANAERYLKLAAEKHDNSATYELIKFYRDYVKYMISESKGVTKVNYYFKLAMK